MTKINPKKLGRSLVMDDDPLILKTLSSFLIRLGFEPILVKNGEEAINYFEEAHKDKNPFHFVILDFMIHNGLNGEETLKKIKQIDPKIKSILSSGYKNEILARYEEFGFNTMLKKPYTIHELKDAITEILS